MRRRRRTNIAGRRSSKTFSTVLIETETIGIRTFIMSAMSTFGFTTINKGIRHRIRPVRIVATTPAITTNTTGNNLTRSYISRRDSNHTAIVAVVVCGCGRNHPRLGVHDGGCCWSGLIHCLHFLFESFMGLSSQWRTVPFFVIVQRHRYFAFNFRGIKNLDPWI